MRHKFFCFKLSCMYAKKLTWLKNFAPKKIAEIICSVECKPTVQAVPTWWWTSALLPSFPVHEKKKPPTFLQKNHPSFFFSILEVYTAVLDSFWHSGTKFHNKVHFLWKWYYYIFMHSKQTSTQCSEKNKATFIRIKHEI